MVGAQREISNRILQSLSGEVFERLRPSARAVHLPHGHLISEEFEEIREIYFLNSGLVSVVKRMQDGRMVEVGAIGRDGVTNPFSLCGIGSSSLEAVVQIPVSAISVPRAALLEELPRDGLRQLVQNYAQYLIRQIAQTAACNRLHSIMERSCRWILAAHTAARADTFFLTHEFLAEMLGVQRSGVTAATIELKGAGMIDYSHGRISILDQQALENASCECYLETQKALEMVFNKVPDL